MSSWAIQWLSPSQNAALAWGLHAVLLLTCVGASWLAAWVSDYEEQAPTVLEKAWRKLLGWTGYGGAISGLLAWYLFQKAQPEVARTMSTALPALPWALCISWLLWLGALQLSVRWTGEQKPYASWPRWIAPLLGTAALIFEHCLQLVRLEPGPWLETRWTSWQWLTVPWIALAAVQLMLALSLGTLWIIAHYKAQPKLDRKLTAVLGLASLVGVAVLWTIRSWLPPLVLLDLDYPGAPNLIPSQAARLAQTGAMGWLSLGLILTLFLAARMQKLPRSLAVLLTAIGLLTAGSLLGAYESLLGPWGLRNRMYANGLTPERIVSDRRSTFFPGLGFSQEQLGPELFKAQCATCHRREQPVRAQLGQRQKLGVRKELEQLREADRYGHPYRTRMPPLLGSDTEVDSLAQWLSSLPP